MTGQNRHLEIFSLRVLTLAALFLLPTMPGRAGLRWESTVVERAAKLGEATVEVPFSFTVEGDQPVHILDAGTSCGCTVATLQKRIYKPGETGVITARFTPGERQGLQEKTVNVKLIESGAERQETLTLKVTMPTWIYLEKSRLEWERGEKSESKSLHITTVAGATVELKPLDPDKAKDLKIELRSDLDEGGYIFSVTPEEGRKSGIIAVFLQADLKGAKMASVPVILRFR